MNSVSSFLRPALMLLAPLLACSAPPRPQAPPLSQQMATLLGSMDRIGLVRFPLVRPGSVLPAEFNRPVRWHWSGTLEQGVSEIARQVGYSAEVGDATGSGPAITISEDNATEATLLDELSAASNPTAEVDVDIPAHLIRIIRHG